MRNGTELVCAPCRLAFHRVLLALLSVTRLALSVPLNLFSSPSVDVYRPSALYSFRPLGSTVILSDFAVDG